MAEDYESMTVAQLKELLKEQGLPVSGKKTDLIARLLEADGQTDDAVEEDAPVEEAADDDAWDDEDWDCLLYTSPSPRDQRGSRMPSSA